jgi:hypothetical protein
MERQRAFYSRIVAIKNQGDLVTDEASKIYLQNKVAKVRSKLSAIDSEMAIKDKETAGLNNLKEAYINHPGTGDPADIHEVSFVQTLFMP